MPGVLGVVRAGAREPAVVRAVRVHQVQLVEPAPLRRVRDRSAVGGPPRAAVVHVGDAGEAPDRAGVDARHADLAASVLVGACGERVGDLGAVRRHVGVALVAARVEVAVPGGEPTRPRVVDVQRSPAGSSGPRRAPRRSAGGRRRSRAGCRPRPAVAAGRRRPRPATRGPRPRTRRWTRPARAGGGVLPVRHGVAAGRQAPGRATVLEVDQPHVRAVVAVLDEHRPAAVAAYGKAARPRRVGDRLEPPVPRARRVRPRLREHALALVLADPDRAVLTHARALPPRCPSAPRAPARRACLGRSRPPAPPRSEGRAARARGPRH